MAAAGLYLGLLAPEGLCTGLPWIGGVVNTIGVVSVAVVSIAR